MKWVLGCVAFGCHFQGVGRTDVAWVRTHELLIPAMQPHCLFLYFSIVILCYIMCAYTTASLLFAFFY